MTNQQVADLAQLQSQFFTEVYSSSESGQREKLDLIVYYIRKQIFLRVEAVLKSVDILAAANFSVSSVQLTRKELQMFGLMQTKILKAKAKNSDDGAAVWLAYIHWIDDVIAEHLSIRTAKYIKVQVKPEGKIVAPNFRGKGGRK